MIARLSGHVVELEADSLIVEVGGGIGLQVFVPAATRQGQRPGSEVFLYTHLVVREDNWTLYGFEKREELTFFNLLLSVQGIGPKIALSILSTLSPDAIRRAVFHEQPEMLSRVPGVGRKTAQKILLYLQDKLPQGGVLEAVAAISDVDTEVLSALTTLGYSVVEAQAALQSIPREAPQEVETRLRLALQYFSS